MESEQRRIDGRTVHAGLFLLCFAATALLSSLAWPRYLLVPIAGYLTMVAVMPSLRRTMPRPAVGRIDRVAAGAAVVLTVLSSAVLIGYQHLFQPDLSDSTAAGVGVRLADPGRDLHKRLQCRAGGLTSRWVLYEAITAEWGTVAANVVTSAWWLPGVLIPARVQRGFACMTPRSVPQDIVFWRVTLTDRRARPRHFFARCSTMPLPGVVP